VSFTNGKFGLLTIRKEISPDIFHCDCACGNELHVWRSLLANNVQKDCGMCRATGRCGRGNFRPGLAGHVRRYKRRDGSKGRKQSGEYNSYSAMKQRCYDEKYHAYPLYGGRGIRVCKRWMLPDGEGFRNFIKAMGVRPVGKTLDRIDPQGHYEPTNCQWADAETQQKNKRLHLYPDGDVPKLESYRAMEQRIEEEFEEQHPY